MNKELEVYFKRIKSLQICINYEKDIFKSVDEVLPNSCSEVEQALQRLEAIDNANPNEAMKCLEKLDCMDFHRSIDTYVPEINRDVSETQYLSNTNEFHTIKQALLKSQEFNNVLKKYNIENIEELEKILNLFSTKNRSD